MWKRATDIVGSLFGLLLAAPVILTAAIAIKATSKGPIFFRQLRTGQFGNPFVMYKLRTMVVDAEELKAKLHALNERDGPAFKIKNDPRVTSVGKFLRSTGIDELPQLWNILIGNMAIVGPRPLPCHEDAQCKTWQRRRLDTKPGLTCVWQISKSRDVSFEDWMRMDLQYSRKRSVRSDVTLVFKTGLAVFLGRVGH
jgi:lipopolysaccharide/colanic/teichoic acid biosynthesis glycosyltransferase